MQELVAAIEEALASGRLTAVETGRFHGLAALCFLLTEHSAAAVLARHGRTAEARNALDGALACYAGFLSRRTVQTHVSHILAKLGLKSRVELAVSASRRSPHRPAPDGAPGSGD